MGKRVDIPANEAERLLAVHALDPLRGTKYPPLDRLAALAAEVCHAPTAIISLIDADRQVYLSTIGADSDGVDRADSFCTLAILDDTVLTTSDASIDPRFSANIHAAGENGIRSYVGVPVRSLNGMAVGTICIASTQLSAFGLEERRRLEVIGELVTELFARLQSEFETREAKRRTQAAERRAISLEHAFDAVHEGVTIIDRTGDVVTANSHAKKLFDVLPGALVGRSFRNPVERVVGSDGREMSGDEFAVATTFRTGEPVADMVYGLPLPDGSRRWVSTSTTPVYDGAGEIDYIVAISRDVTESHLQTEALKAALREAEKAKDYARALNTIAEAVAITDANGICMDCNAGFLKLTGRTRDAQIGHDILQRPLARYSEDGARLADNQSAIRRALETRQPVRDSIVAIDVGAERRWHAISAAPILDDAGAVVRVVLIFRDIHEERVASSLLSATLRQAKRAQLAINTIAEGVHLYDAAGVIIDANVSAGRILGLTKDQMMGRAYVDPRWRVIGPDGEPIASEDLPIARCLASGKPVVEAVLGVEKPDATLTWISVNAVPMRGLDQSVVNVAVTFRDITQKKAYQEQLLAALQEAQRAEHYAEALNVIAEAVVIFDADGYLVDCNAGLLRLLTRPRSALIGISYQEWPLRRYRPDGSLLAFDDTPLRTVYLTGESVRDDISGIDTTDGERRWHSVSAVPIHNKDTGALERVVKVIRDITDERRASDLVTDALEVARKSSQAKSDFLAVMSHELRTPMNAVLGAAQMLSMKRLEPEERRTLAMLEDSGRQMMTLLNDLFDVAALEGDRVRIEPEPVSIATVIEEAAMICRRDALSKGLTVETLPDPALVAPRLIDPSRLRQIVGNLLVNAVKFTDRGGVRIRTRLVEHPGEIDQVAIEVSDTGVGIASEDIARIFQPFEQVDASTRRRHGGMGIGLNVVRRLARHMGGDISLESSPGQGSTFTITLNAPLAARIEVAAPHPPSGEGESRFSLMCVDDNPRNLIVIAALLRAAGHSVLECGSGEAALQAAASEPFDAILLDMVMPDMDGLDVLAHIQAKPGPNQAAPVIACTANVMPEQLKSYLAAGVADVVEKPIQAAVLLEAVNAVVHSNRQANRLDA